MGHFEKKISAERLYKGRVLSFEVHRVELENGDTATREMIVHHGGVAIAALDEQDRLLMVRQYRYAVAQELLELPAGKLEPGEEPMACGLRELEEETGCAAERLVPLAEVYPVPPYCTEKIYVMRAEGLTRSSQHLDDDEFITVERVPFEEALRMVMAGEILDSKTQVGILKLAVLRSQGKI